MRELPSGTVTFLFTDVEGSTRLLHELGAEAYADALAEHRRVIREACVAQGGVEVDTQGDAFLFAFPTAPGALAAASALTSALASGPIQVRVGLHTGTPLVTGEGYVGGDVHRAARIAAAGHGGQVLVSSSTATLVELELRDIGEQRFKDLAAPERVYQLGDRDFPPLESLHRTNLPVPATPFLGRERELAEVVELLSREDVHLLTLTGPGGTGKTRLALQAAAEVSDRFTDGVWWVPLARLRDATLVLPAIASVLDVKEQPGKPVADTLRQATAGKRALLLVDNLEHLLPDGALELAAFAAVQGPSLLVTSRERLQLQSEQIYPVPTLDEAEGVVLFRARARSLDPAFTENGGVAELCSRLDNLPLALELAAARTSLFSPAQLLERLSERLDLFTGARDADPRQQTLRATIEWSYELLDPEEQRFFRSLSVFAGGCSLDAAEQVCGGEPDTLQSLLDKSLLRRRDSEFGPRFWMLETIRDYAAEQLGQTGDDAQLRLRHAEWYCGLAERLGGMPPVRSLDEGFGSLPADYDNVRSGLAWAWDSGQNELGLRFGPACLRFWMHEARFREAVSWLERATSAVAAAGSRIRLGALRASGVIALLVLADTTLADEHWSQALPVAEELGATEDIRWIESMRAGAAWARGDLELALSLQQRNLTSARETGDRRSEASVLHLLGAVLRDLGRFEEAESAFLDADAIFRELGTPRGIANNLHSLADLALDRGDLATAEQLYRDSLELDLRHGSAHGESDVAHCLAGLAGVLADAGRDVDAATVWGAVCASEDAFGFRMMASERRRYESRLARLENTPAWTEGRRMSLAEAAEYMRAPP